MSLHVRVVVPARNEQRRLGALLTSVAHALRMAEAQGADWRVDICVVLDRCEDQTAMVSEAHGVRLLVCPPPGGKVEALRTGIDAQHDAQVDVFVCIDADVVVGPRTLFDLVNGLLHDPEARASCPPLQPLAPEGLQTPVGWALHRYNRARGFSSERLWLSGRCYAVRAVRFPTPAELRRRATMLPRAEPALGAPLQADDVWLSRMLWAQHPRAILHVETDPVQYRAPSSLRGMSRTYRRLRRELVRIDRLFPELPGPGRDRRVDRLHGLRDHLAFGIFQAALQLCRAHAALEQLGARWLARPIDPWPVVAESKT